MEELALDISQEELAQLNSKKGLRSLLQEEEFSIKRTLRILNYESELKKAQEELIKLQNWIIKNGERVVILFEGRDAAGKGGAIRRFTHYLNPRYLDIKALPRPTEYEQGQWYFQRYISCLPDREKMTFFDRSWYNRAVVEPVNGFCTERQYELFMSQVNDFERMLTEDGVHIIKLYFSISKNEQKERFEDIASDPLKRWKMSPVDAKAQELWDVYTSYKDKMFEKTNTEHCPWTIIKANRKTSARLEAIKHVLGRFPYAEQTKS